MTKDGADDGNAQGRPGEVQEYLVSASGQMTVPAGFRRRWGLDYGGPVMVIDAGEVLIVVPQAARQHLLASALSAEEHLEFVRGLDDPDLATT